MKPEIGRVYYAIMSSDKGVRVAPCLVTEEVTKKTINETITDIFVTFDGDETVLLSTLKLHSDLQLTPEGARDILFSIISKHVDKTIEDAVKRANNVFGSTMTSNPSTQIQEPKSITADQVVEVNLPDGRIARARIN